MIVVVAGEDDRVLLAAALDAIEEALAVERIAVSLIHVEGDAGAGFAIDSGEGNLLGDDLPSGLGLTEGVEEPFFLGGAEEGAAGVREGGAGALDGFAGFGDTYGFDPWGNRWVTGRPGMPPLLGIPFAGTDYNAKNRMVLSGQTESDVYDGSGNQKRIGAMNLIYDAEGRVATATNTGNGNMEYRYDGEERRVMSLVNGAVSKLFVYDAMGQLAVEYGGVVGSGTEFLTADLLGSVRAITDSTGAVTQRRDYGPFGEELAGGDRSPGPPAEPRMKFTGKERDAETGLDYFGARYFSGAQGRFTSPDTPFEDQYPANPQSWNLYTYVRNNPLIMVDHDGASATIIGAAGGALIGGAVAAWRGESVWKGAASGAVAGALAGVVIDTGGAALGVYGAAAAGGALGGVGGGVVDRALNGRGTAAKDVAVDAVVGAAGGVAVAGLGRAVGAVAGKLNSKQLFRAVGEAEAESLQSSGSFKPSPTGSDVKGFFYSQKDAKAYGDMVSKIDGPQKIVQTSAPKKLVESSPQHSAAKEGPGVYIRNQDLPKLSKPKVK